LERLEDRTLLDGATHFRVLTPDFVIAGVPTPAAVMALDDSNQIVFNYLGTAHVSCSDPNAHLPADYTFTFADHGEHVFPVVLQTTGSQIITATDAVHSSISGSTTVTVNAPPAATHLQVIVPEHAPAGVPIPIAVVAQDGANHLVPGYTGTIHFTSADSAASLPADYTFTSDDHGVHTFSVTFGTTGEQSVTASDTANNSITGSASVDVSVVQTAATHFEIMAPPVAASGIAFPVTVIALDASNHPTPGYMGTVQFASSDGAAVLPASYTFTDGDRGVHVFMVTLATAGGQTVSVADSANNSIAGQAEPMVVVPAPATHLGVRAPDAAPSGSSFPVEVVALDASNQPVFGYAGTVHFTSSDSSAILPADFTFTHDDHGVHEFPINLQSAGSQTISVADTANPTVAGSVTISVIHPAAANHFGVRVPDAAPAGSSFPVQVVALDTSNQPVFGYTGTVHFTSSDSSATLPPDFTFTPDDHGVHEFAASLQAGGTQTIQVTDTAQNSISGSATLMVIPPAVVTHFGVLAPPAASVGAQFPVQVVALDASNQPVFGYTGTVHFTSSDGAANLPADFTFTLDDHGAHAFPITLQTGGSQTITVTDASDSSITGNANVTVVRPNAVTHFGVFAHHVAAASVPFPVGVVALDADNHPVPTYTGTIHFMSSDAAANLPVDYTFTADDHGSHIFSVTLQTPGSQTLGVSDTVHTMVAGGTMVLVIPPSVGAATHFGVIAPPMAPAGAGFPLIVIALDAINRPAIGYTGTVHFTSSDSGAHLPADFTFGSGDFGIHVFEVALASADSQTITVTDTSNSAISGMATTMVFAPAVVTHFGVFAPPAAPGGSPFPVGVVALDASNHPVTSYMGTVHFTSSDSNAHLPSDYTFTDGDHGMHVFGAALGTAGSQTITVTDTANSSITGGADVMVVPPAVATHFRVFAPPGAPIGETFPMAIVALDASNHLVPTYTGTVHFTSSDPAANLPADYTFTGDDHGAHIFPVSLQTPGSQTLTAMDTSDSSITGSATVVVMMPFGVVTHFGVLAPDEAAAGSPFPLAVVALDDADHPVANYTGTVHFTSSDSAAHLPMDYTFTPDDHGVHLFPIVLGTAGSQTITVTDTSRSLITGTATVMVETPRVTTHFGMLASPVVPAGDLFPVAIVALDASNHPVTDYTGTVHFTSSDSGAHLPMDYTFTADDHGAHVFQVSLQTGGSQTITVTDTSNSSITGSATILVVPPRVATHFGVRVPMAVPAGSTFPVEVVALDASNEPVFGYSGTVHFTSSDAAANLPADYTFMTDDHGVHAFQATMTTLGSQTITVTDTSSSSVTGNAALTVMPALVATHFGVVAPPAVPSGSAFPLGVVALDASNHPVPNYTGTVHFTSSDSGAGLPANYTFTADDHGVHLFHVTLHATGGQTISVADTSSPSITGSATIRVVDHNALFVNQVYQDLLGRSAEPAAQAAWVAALAQDLAPNDFVQTIESSPEYRSGRIDNLYTTLLGRHADVGGLNGFLIAMSAGMTIEQIKSLILSSPEFFARSGGTNAGFLAALYQDVLGRTIDSAGAVGWGTQLQLGLDRGIVATDILMSGEAHQDMVEHTYQEFLNRAADVGGLIGWSIALEHGLRDEAFLAAIIGSGEFIQGL
jgi:uncharacterized protein YqfB (UPF0267 family)